MNHPTCINRLARTVVAVAVALFGSASVASESPPVQVRGLLLVTVDTLRADHVGAYGGPVATPSFDRLAREGVLLEQAVTPTPSTGPAHASLLTGLYPWDHHVLDNAVPLSEGAVTLAERLREQGFRTAAFVSSYILHPRWRFDQGFDTYVFAPTESYVWRGARREGFWTRGEATTAAAMRWLTRTALPDGSPFMLWVHYFDPHRPYLPPPGYALDPDAPVDLSGRSVPEGVRGPQQLRRLIRGYRGEVRYADAQVGRLVQRLELLGILESTVVVITSDHGEGLGDHGVLEHGVNLHDELIRVPLIVRAPGLSAGRRLDGSAQLEDLVPTLLSLLGRPAVASGSVDGFDLAPWLRGEVSESPRPAAVGRRKASPNRAPLYYQRGHSRKWIGTPQHAGEVFELDGDPRELDGRVGSGTPAWLRSRIERGIAPAAELPSAAPDAETERALRALGYAE